MELSRSAFRAELQKRGLLVTTDAALSGQTDPVASYYLNTQVFKLESTMFHMLVVRMGWSNEVVSSIFNVQV